MPTPRFFYFDLGRVLVGFTVERMFRQMAEVAGIAPEQAREALFADGLQVQYEVGAISTRDYYEGFCRRAGVRPDFGRLAAAASDIFTWRPCVAAVAVQLRQAGHRLGVLSNTSELHWEHCLRRYCVLRETFSVYTLSYRVRRGKPEPPIYLAAAEAAGCAPEEVFFVDDHPANVEGARAVGIDAVQYTTTAELAATLRARGARFNY